MLVIVNSITVSKNVSNCIKEWTCALLHPARDRPLFTAYSALLDFSVSISNSRESLKARRARKARRTSNSSNTIEMNPRACRKEILFCLCVCVWSLVPSLTVFMWGRVWSKTANTKHKVFLSQIKVLIIVLHILVVLCNQEAILIKCLMKTVKEHDWKCDVKNTSNDKLISQRTSEQLQTMVDRYTVCSQCRHCFIVSGGNTNKMPGDCEGFGHIRTATNHGRSLYSALSVDIVSRRVTYGCNLQEQCVQFSCSCKERIVEFF